MAVATLVISFIYLLLLRPIAGPLTWTALFLLLLLQIAGGVWAYTRSSDFPEGSSNNKAYMYSGIGLFVVAFIYLICLCCCWKNIARAVGIVKATSRFSQQVPTIFAVPVVFFFIILIWVLYWTASALYLYSIGEPVKRDGDIPIADIKWDKNTRYLFLTHVFGLFWVGAFIIGAAQFVIAATTVQWYFNSESENAGKGSVMLGVKWLFRYHLGSIAFGALIIAIMQMIKLMFEYIRKKFEVRNNKCMEIMWNVVRCCIWCVDYYIRFITKNAYIQIAVKGVNFCSGAKGAFFLIIRNVAQFGITLGIANILMFIGKAFIMGVSGFLTYIILEKSSISEKLFAPFVPVIVVIIIAYLTSSIFLSVFSFAANTMLHCLFFDCEIGGGHTPKSLQDFVDEKEDLKSAQQNASKRRRPKDTAINEGGDGGIEGKEDGVANNME